MNVLAILLPSRMTRILTLLAMSASVPSVSNAFVYSNFVGVPVFDNCTGCHSVSLTGAARDFAPTGVNFDNYTESVINNVSRPSSYCGAATNTLVCTVTKVQENHKGTYGQTVKDNLETWVTTQGAPKAAPTITTETATSPTGSSIDLGATFNPNVHSGTTVRASVNYNYGLTTGYGSTASVVPTFAGTNDVTALDLLVTGLNCNTTYHYQAEITNGHDTTYSIGDPQFSTDLCQAPVISYNVSAPLAFDEDTDQTFTLKVSTDPSISDNAITWSLVNADGGATKGDVTFTSDITVTPVTLNYHPDLNANGADTVTVRVTDAEGSSIDFPVALTINALADSPVIMQGAVILGNDLTVAMDEDGSPIPFSLTLSATDPDAATIFSWSIATAATDGVASVTAATGATKVISYTPKDDDNGNIADSFVVAVWDGAIGSSNADMLTVNLDIAAQQDDPVAEPDSVSLAEGDVDKLLTVITNDSDPDAGETAALVLIDIMDVSSNLTSATVDGKQIKVTHDGSQDGAPASLSYQVMDTTGRKSNRVTVSITVNTTDDPPTSTAINAGNVVEGMSSIIDAVAASNDPENGKTTLAVCDLASTFLTVPTSGNATVSINAGGNILYQHNGTNVAASGDTDSFTYRVNDNNDGTCASGNNSNVSTVTISLQPANDLPVAQADIITVAEGGVATMLDGGNLSVLDNDTDEENGIGTGFTVSTINPNTQPGFNKAFSLNPDGTFSYEHDGSEPVNTSFTYYVNDGAIDSATSATVTINVTAVNDAPSITSTPDITPLIEGDIFTYQVTAVDPDDAVIGGELAASLSNQPPGMIIDSTGLITWTVGRSNVFDNAFSDITVTIADDGFGSDDSVDALQTFTLITSPIDTDNDGAADYADNCPAIANSGQEDLDNDTAHLAVDASGIPAVGDVDPTATDTVNALGESYLKGGDACDEDIDSDGISNAAEAANGLNPKDASDASADRDGDGLSNLEEFTACGTDTLCANISIDSVAPEIFVQDLRVISTGYLTPVDMGATAIDNVNTKIKPTSDKQGPFRPGHHIVNWSAADAAGNTSTAQQIIDVLPLLSLAEAQVSGEGRLISVDIKLNGPAPTYPVIIDYALSGDATSADHDLSAGQVQIDNGTLFNKSFTILNDSNVEADEALIITLSGVSGDAALSDSVTHRVLITENNVEPSVILNVVQAGINGPYIYQDQGSVTITAQASDPNGDVLSFDWSESDTLLSGSPVGNQFTFDASTIAPGSYAVSVKVSDDFIQTQRYIELLLAATAPVLTASDDADNDGLDDLSEGRSDDDADGVPNYLDAVNEPTLLHTRVRAGANNALRQIQSTPGVRLVRGSHAVLSQHNGARISASDIIDADGNVVTDTGFSVFGGYFDFEIHGLSAARRSATVVLPLTQTIPANASYRKFINDNWSAFIEDGVDQVRSAFSIDKECPAAGDAAYQPGLLIFSDCVALTLTDGGPNDADQQVNGVIRDPGGVAIDSTVPGSVHDNSLSAPGAATGGAGSLSWFWFTLLSLAFYQRRKQGAQH